MDDATLLVLLKRRPEAGMKQLMEQYAPLVYAVVKGKLSVPPFCRADIEACTADAFSEFYLALDSYRPGKGSIRSWLCAIARHNAVDMLRKSGKTVTLKEDVLFETDMAEDVLRAQLLEAVRALEQPDREILLRKYYLGEPSKDIAARLGMTVSAVDTRSHRAVERLRKRLGGEGS